MPESKITRRDDRPTEGFSTAHLSAYPDRPVRMFLPSDYQPKYAYPLVILFHAEGGDEDAAARLIPNLSRRNYVAACLRGPVTLGPGATGRPGFGWGEPDPQTKDYVFAAVAHARRAYHVHSERVYLIGIGEGATVALQLGLAMANKVAGVVALNGELPAPGSRPLARLKTVRGLRMFLGHGVHNPVIPHTTARRGSRLLHAAGADVRFVSYPTTHRVHPDMLRDANRWIMGAVTTDPDSPTTPNDG